MLIQYERLTATSNLKTPEADGLRDHYMATNASWLLGQAGLDKKMIIIAHNGHVQDTPMLSYYVVSKIPKQLWNYYTTPTMGVYLRQTYGNNMVIIGFSFHSGQYNAASYGNNGYGRIKAQTAPPLLENSHEEYLADVSFPRYILDLRTTLTAAPAISSWFKEPRWLRNHRNVYDPNDISLDFQWVVLPDAFDIFIYFEETTPTQLR
jgi:erythromycin esterase-like protein